MGPDYLEGLKSKMTAINNPASPSSAHKSAQPTSLGHRLQVALTSGLGGKLSAANPPSGGAASPPLAMNRRLSFPILALLAALVVGLLLLLPGGPVQAQDAGTMSYAENGTDPVYTFSAGDPEEVDTIVWSILVSAEENQNLPGGNPADDVAEADVVDADDFRITADGELYFKKSPNFEDPRANDADNDGTPEDGPLSNTYRVTVQASDGGSSNNADEAMVFVTWFKATVRVTDVEEDGRLTLNINPTSQTNEPTSTVSVSLVQPQVGTIIGAFLSDPDGPSPIANITWRWYRTSDLAQEGEVILNADDTAEHDEATYTPRDRAGANDVDMYLRVKATYEDRRGRRKTAEAVSPFPTLAAIVNEDTIPRFAATTAERRVNENTDSGTEVGRPVTANDPDDEKLSYSLVAASGTDTDVASFRIHPVTGQITVSPSADLNFEPQQEGQQRYIFQVRATDSRAGSTGEPGKPDNITVTVLVTDLDESPEIGRPATDDRAPVLIVHAGGNAIEHAEDEATAIATYLVTDDDEGTPDLSVTGDDAGLFTFRYDAATTPVNNDAVFGFKARPNFENPADQNGDNIYEVTLQADDGNSSPGTLDVTVKVTNAEEDGEVTLSHQQPLIGQALTAMVADPDGGFEANGGLTRVAWAWHWAETTPEGACPAVDAGAADSPVWMLITPRVTGNEFTPRAREDGDCLRVTATYLDRTYDYPHPPELEVSDPAPTGFGATAQVVSGVVREDPANSKPNFAMDPVARFVPENTSGYKYAGEPVTATDADRDTLSYSLDGADKDSFSIAVSTIADDDTPTDDRFEQALAGQISVAVRTKLDHETDRQYDVVVQTTDSTSTNADAFDTTNVDIHVTDVDEKPDIWVVENGLPVRPNEGVFNVPYEEETTAEVLTLMAEDPEEVRNLVWSLLGDAYGRTEPGYRGGDPSPGRCG